MAPSSALCTWKARSTGVTMAAAVIVPKGSSLERKPTRGLVRGGFSEGKGLGERGAQGEDARSGEGTEAKEGLSGWPELASSFSPGWVGTGPQSQIRGWW